MIKTRVKTKYKGLLWVHQKYVEAVVDGETLVIVHEGQEMTITKTLLKSEPPVKGKELYTEQWGDERGQKYRLFGFKFEPDQTALF